MTKRKILLKAQARLDSSRPSSRKKEKLESYITMMARSTGSRVFSVLLQEILIPRKLFCARTQAKKPSETGQPKMHTVAGIPLPNLCIYN